MDTVLSLGSYILIKDTAAELDHDTIVHIDCHGCPCTGYFVPAGPACNRSLNVLNEAIDRFNLASPFRAAFTSAKTQLGHMRCVRELLTCCFTPADLSTILHW